MGFRSTDSYIVSDTLAAAVNAAVTLEKPLLLKGEPGTGKTRLAQGASGRVGCRVSTMVN